MAASVGVGGTLGESVFGTALGVAVVPVSIAPLHAVTTRRTTALMVSSFVFMALSRGTTGVSDWMQLQMKTVTGQPKADAIDTRPR